MERKLKPPRRLHRLLGRLTAATSGIALSAIPAHAVTRGGAASIAASPPADFDGDPPGVTVPDNPDEDVADPRHAAAAHWLAISLERMEPLPATYTACTWTLSSDPEQRVTIAGALEWTFRLVGDSIIVDHLSRDPEARVRAAAARAAWARHAAGVDEQILARLAADPEPEVREIARLAMRGR